MTRSSQKPPAKPRISRGIKFLQEPTRTQIVGQQCRLGLVDLRSQPLARAAIKRERVRTAGLQLLTHCTPPPQRSRAPEGASHCGCPTSRRSQKGGQTSRSHVYQWSCKPYFTCENTISRQAWAHSINAFPPSDTIFFPGIPLDPPRAGTRNNRLMDYPENGLPKFHFP